MIAKLKRKIRFTLRKYLSDKFLRSYYRSKKPKLQKFWFGSPSIPCPKFEQRFFDTVNLKGEIIGYADIYKPAARVDKKLSFELSHSNPEAKYVEFALGIPESCEDFKGYVEINEKKYIISDLVKGKWCDLRFNLGASKVPKISLHFNQDFHLSFPRIPTQIKLDQPKHVIVIVMDALVVDALSLKHPFRKEEMASRSIQNFFSHGKTFLNGVSNSEWTLPAVASFLTSQHTSSHLLYHPRQNGVLPLQTKNLFEIFQEDGFFTMCASVASRINPSFGHSRGIDSFHYHFPELSEVDYDPRHWIRETIDHIESHHSEKTFSYIHFPDTHPSWEIPPITKYMNLSVNGDMTHKYREGTIDDKIIPNHKEFSHQLFASRLSEIDLSLEMLFSYVKKSFPQDSLIVLTSDHGIRYPYLSEEHVKSRPFLIEERVSIPFFVWSNALTKELSSELVEPNIDLMPTLLDLCKLKAEGPTQGVDLTKENRPRRDWVISESIFNSCYEIAVRDIEHVFFSKFEFDENLNKIKSSEPFYISLFKRSYRGDLGMNYSIHEQEKETFEKLKNIALNHLKEAKLF